MTDINEIALRVGLVLHEGGALSEAAQAVVANPSLSAAEKDRLTSALEGWYAAVYSFCRASQ